MVVLVTGASHTGKTLLAQKLLERYGYPYLSLDLLKMGLIRSRQTDLTPEDDGELTGYLWPIAREIIKTAIENCQNLVVEGCYIPFDWADSFPPAYRKEICWRCLVLSEPFIRSNFPAMKAHANDVEDRQFDEGFSMEYALRENAAWREGCEAHGLPYTLMDEEYKLALEL